MVKIKSISEQSCPEGQTWCPIKKHCMPDKMRPGKGKQFGKGKGPVGSPKQEAKIDKLVDDVFDEGFDKFGKTLALEKQVDLMLDKFGSNKKDKGTVNVSVSPTMQGGVDVRVSESIDILFNILENEDYKTYFKNKLKDFGYDSPADIPDDKKKEFFNSVDKGWKANNE